MFCGVTCSTVYGTDIDVSCGWSGIAAVNVSITCEADLFT
jgi:hypothetical protein